MIALAGASIHACHATGRHILAFEEDKDIFDAFLAPMGRTVVLPQPEILPVDIVSVNLDEEDAPIKRILKTSCFSKSVGHLSILRSYISICMSCTF